MKKEYNIVRGIICRTDSHKQKIRETQLKRVVENVSNLTRKSQCIHCGAVMQENMIKRWHNEKCKNYWSYKSKKLQKQ